MEVAPGFPIGGDRVGRVDRSGSGRGGCHQAHRPPHHGPRTGHLAAAATSPVVAIRAEELLPLVVRPRPAVHVVAPEQARQVAPRHLAEVVERLGQFPVGLATASRRRDQAAVAASHPRLIRPLRVAGGRRQLREGGRAAPRDGRRPGLEVDRRRTTEGAGRRLADAVAADATFGPRLDFVRFISAVWPWFSGRGTGGPGFQTSDRPTACPRIPGPEQNAEIPRLPVASRNVQSRAQWSTGVGDVDRRVSEIPGR